MKKAMLFINGEMRNPSVVSEQITGGDYLVAVDGGLYHLFHLGLQPDILIGDLDSVEVQEVERLRKAGVRILKYPVDKDDTDLELALQQVVQEGYTQIRLVAGLGGRLDQTLGNIYLLTNPALEMLDLRMDDGVDEVFIIRQSSSIHGCADEVVSLLPLSDMVEGVHTQGLKYPLNAETLWRHKTRGISNRMLGESARVEIHGGMLLCIHTRKVAKENTSLLTDEKRKS